MTTHRMTPLGLALLALLAMVKPTIGQEECYSLTPSHTGTGADPVAIPLGDGTVWVEHTVTDTFNRAWRVFAADIDGDGDSDVLGTAQFEDLVAWFENSLGDGTAWQPRIVGETIDFVASVFAADIDADGDLDVLGSVLSPSLIAWWENTQGDGTTWTQHTVDSHPFFDNPGSVYAADVDGDGDLDVLASAENGLDGLIAWWENRGDGTEWRQYLVSGAGGYAYSVSAADLDDDGDLDILGAKSTANEVSWWENTSGDGTTWIEHLVAANFEGARSVYATDVNGDGDLDVVGAADYTAWFDNTLGDGTIWTEHIVDPNFPDSRSVHAGDVDGDGDTDVLGASTEDDDIAWWENTLGDGTAWIEHTVAGDFDGARSVYAVDVDGDTDLDVVGAAFDGDRIAWWENTYAGTCPAGQFDSGDRIALTAIPDPDWEVAGWTGTDDDASTEITNTATMPAAGHTISVHYVESGPAGFTLSVTGTCPGEITVTVTTPDPDEEVQLFAGTTEGPSYVPWGLCAGTELGILFARNWRAVKTDENGETALTSAVGANWCGRHLQALDRTCTMSNVVQFP